MKSLCICFLTEVTRASSTIVIYYTCHNFSKVRSNDLSQLCIERERKVFPFDLHISIHHNKRDGLSRAMLSQVKLGTYWGVFEQSANSV